MYAILKSIFLISLQSRVVCSLLDIWICWGFQLVGSKLCSFTLFCSLSWLCSVRMACLPFQYSFAIPWRLILSIDGFYGRLLTSALNHAYNGLGSVLLIYTVTSHWCVFMLAYCSLCMDPNKSAPFFEGLLLCGLMLICGIFLRVEELHVKLVSFSEGIMRLLIRRTFLMLKET